MLRFLPLPRSSQESDGGSFVASVRIKKWLRAVVVIAVLASVTWRIAAWLDTTPKVGYRLPFLILKPILPSTPPPPSLEEIRGQVTVLHYWATWCAPCAAEYPRLLKWADGYRDRPDFRFLSISTGHEDSAALRRETESFLVSNNYPTTVYSDPQSITRSQLHKVSLDTVPLTVVLDREGEVVKVVEGDGEAEFEQVKMLVASLLRAGRN